MKKKFKYDGKSRPSNDLYKKEFDRIFGKKEKTLSEMLHEGFKMEQEMYKQEESVEDPFKKEVKEEKIDDKEFEKIIERNGF